MRRLSGLLAGCLVALILAAPAAPLRGQVRVASPDGRNQVTVEVREGRLSYSLARDGRGADSPLRGSGSSSGGRRRSGTGCASSTPPGSRTTNGGRSRGVRWPGCTTTTTSWPSRWRRPRPRTGGSPSGCERSTTGWASGTSSPEQPGLGAFEITDELTEFSLVDNPRAWWIPSDRPRMDRSEMLYSSGPVSLLQRVQTPLTMETQDGRTFLVIHEANLVDYARMNLRGSCIECRVLQADLAPMGDGILVRGQPPFVTPWRTIQLADRVTDLVPSVLGLNLNPPNALASTDWIHPMKYVGIWWGMHIGTMTWGSGPKHGATTANTRRYIDFAAANGFGGVLVEGWNIGWDGDWIVNRNAFSFTQAYPDYDLAGASPPTPGRRGCGSSSTTRPRAGSRTTNGSWTAPLPCTSRWASTPSRPATSPIPPARGTRTGPSSWCGTTGG